MSRRGGRQTSLPRLQPNPGRWSLDWSLVDRGGPFPWPAPVDPLYSELASYLARHNEMSLGEVLDLIRTNGKSAHHAVPVDDLSDAGQQRFAHVYRVNELDESESGDVEVLVMTFCLAAGDPRRVVCLFNGVNRKVFPLWWDPNHAVTGDNGARSGRVACPGVCYHA